MHLTNEQLAIYAQVASHARFIDLLTAQLDTAVKKLRNADDKKAIFRLQGEIDTLTQLIETITTAPAVLKKVQALTR